MNENRLVKACETGDLKLVKSLVKKGLDISIYNYSPLLHAVWNGHFEIVKYLVEQGSDISIDNYQPLLNAASCEHLDIVLYLRKIAGNKLNCDKCIVAATCMKICEDFVK